MKCLQLATSISWRTAATAGCEIVRFQDFFQGHFKMFSLYCLFHFQH